MFSFSVSVKFYVYSLFGKRLIFSSATFANIIQTDTPGHAILTQINLERYAKVCTVYHLDSTL